MNHDFTSILLAWFRDFGRELPWRGTKDAYAIWLSEIILQQTRIQQGEAYWHRFMQRFPTVEMLAEASEDEVLRLWQGLGYYSRARNLHAAARQIVAAGAFPQTLEGIRALKGVGDYTAAAIASIAFGIDAAAVDGNVYRVLARHFGIATPINSTEGKREFAALAQTLLPHGQAGTFNQALMDFGAIQCTPLSPHCTVCPLAETCVALRSGQVETLPVKQQKTKVQERRLAYIYIRCKDETPIRRRPAGDIWQGLWEPVAVEAPLPAPPVGGRASQARVEGEGLRVEGEGGKVQCTMYNVQSSKFKVQSLQLLAKDVKHVLTHRILYADFYFMEVTEKPSLPEGYIWVKECALDDYAKPRLIEKLLEKVVMMPSPR